ncbi:hypothetical protein C8J57DRAFT_1533591 [Mycena rebaudengoi]|nr:hypothetical protein C8J57DRAFT_1533591 [Mycena rebaudengoi]
MSHNAIPPLDDTLGAIEIVGVRSTLHFGIVTLQAIYYYGKFPTDPKVLKSAVFCWTLMILELGHVLTTWHLIYSLAVTFYSQLQYIQRPPHSLEMTLLFSAPIYFMVQVYFAHRVRKLSARWEITIICWILPFLRVICTFGMLGVTLNMSPLSELEEKYEWLLATALSLGVGADVIIAVSMCCCLWTVRASGADERIVDTRAVDNRRVWDGYRWNQRTVDAFR